MTMHDERDDEVRDELLNAVHEASDDEHFYGAWKRGGRMSGGVMAKAKARMRRRKRDAAAKKAEKAGAYVDRSDEDRRVAMNQKAEDNDPLARAKSTYPPSQHPLTVSEVPDGVRITNKQGGSTTYGKGTPEYKGWKAAQKTSPKAAKQDKPAFSRWAGKQSAWAKGKKRGASDTTPPSWKTKGEDRDRYRK